MCIQNAYQTIHHTSSNDEEINQIFLDGGYRESRVISHVKHNQT